MDDTLELTKKHTDRRIFSINPNNQIFFDSFRDKFKDSPLSLLQYKVDCGAFLESLGQKLLTSVTVEDIESYVNNHNKNDNEKTANNKRSHIRSLLIYATKNDIRGAKTKISREVLVYLIG
jgi:site-specific recombinase XerD